MPHALKLVHSRTSVPSERHSSTYKPLPSSPSRNLAMWKVETISRQLEQLNKLRPAHVGAIGLLVERLLSDAIRRI